ncbi:MAG: hypothetical protein OXU30_05385 [Gammaproteobacteria bacterium]|nr:hypothetical protein [Gammaproteobacteria bacterium]
MFVWLENSTVGMWVSSSLWAYPFLLSVHIVGLAIVVGLFSMRDLRLLGMFGTLPVNTFSNLGKLALAGFILNAISGLLLFTSQASIFVTSVPFVSKIVAITAGMILAHSIQKKLNDDISSSTRILASISIACWIAAIIGGRLIAYIF